AQSKDSDAVFLRGSLFWSLLSAIALTQYMGIVEARGSWILEYPRQALISWAALAGAVIYALGWLVSYGISLLAKRSLRFDPFDLLLWSTSGLFYGTLVALGFLFFLREAGAAPGDPSVLGKVADSPVVYLIFGVPWILMAQWISDLVFTGLTSY